ncbi:MAG TPA: M28 family peptidase [Vicinamibacterales bacterium]|nr:M28 family peptidase [Acidobacteriota bacterium]HOC17273.1 M28 family peptidase [Vicinamibacterales bacterium]
MPVRTRRLRVIVSAAAVLVLVPLPLLAQARGLRAIEVEDMQRWLRFLGSKEFRGRAAPSIELDLASRYLAVEAAHAGLEPLLPGGSFLQHVPVEVTTISGERSRIRLSSPGGELRLAFPAAFTSSVQLPGDWSASGPLVFAGTALAGPQPKWDDAVASLRGRWVVVFEEDGRARTADERRAASAARDQLLRDRGALGLIVIIAPDREARLAAQGLDFDVSRRLRFLDVDTVNPPPPPLPGAAPPPVEPMPVNAVEVRHQAAADILGVTPEEVARMAHDASENRVVPPRPLPGRSADVEIFFETRQATTPNVVAWLPGSDPKLRGEYVLIGSHHDHNPPREGRVFPGADDNGSGAVGMLSLARALVAERPKRSVVFVWHTAEERGLVGAYYFVQHSPVPVEKISAVLNLDMISRNDPNAIYLIGSNQVSSELDASLRRMNDRHVGLSLDYKYEDPGEPSRFFFRSDHYPYIRYGIPAVWLFCGTTEDYHREGDMEEKVDYAKMEKVVRLAYLVAMDVGNKAGLLQLDVHPQIKARGAHNMKVVWRRR